MSSFFTRRRLAILLALMILSAPFIVSFGERMIADMNRANLSEEQLQATVDSQLTRIASDNVTPTFDVDQRVAATLTALAPPPAEQPPPSGEPEGFAPGIGAFILGLINGVLGFIWGLITGVVGFIAGILGGLFGGVNALTMCCAWVIVIGAVLVVIGAANGGL